MINFKHSFILFLFLISLTLGISSFKPQKDRTDLLARKWVMTSMKVEDKNYSEAMLERQRQQGLVTILRFSKGGVCTVYIKTPKGRTTKRNQWKFVDDQNKLFIKAESGETQTFNIVKLSAKKMQLSIDDNGTTQVFNYKSIK